MYELPGMDNVTEVIIDENMIVGDAQPILIYTCLLYTSRCV